MMQNDNKNRTRQVDKHFLLSQEKSSNQDMINLGDILKLTSIDGSSVGGEDPKGDVPPLSGQRQS